MAMAERPPDDGPSARGEVHLRSRDPVEASALAAHVYHEHRLTILGDHRAFAMTLDAASLGPITLGWLLYDTEIRVDAEPHADAYQINLVTAGRVSGYCGSHQIVATSSTGMIFGPDRPTGFTGWRTTSLMLGIKIERHALEDELEQLLHRPVTGPIAFGPALDLSRRGPADWNRLVCTLATGLFEPGSLFRRPIMTAPLVHACPRIHRAACPRAAHSRTSSLLGGRQHARTPAGFPTIAGRDASPGHRAHPPRASSSRSHQLQQRRSDRGRHRREMGLPARWPLCRSLSRALPHVSVDDAQIRRDCLRLRVAVTERTFLRSARHFAREAVLKTPGAQVERGHTLSARAAALTACGRSMTPIPSTDQ